MSNLQTHGKIIYKNNYEADMTQKKEAVKIEHLKNN